jgi:hypothetical protein
MQQYEFLVLKLFRCEPFAAVCFFKNPKSLLNRFIAIIIVM